MTKRARKLVREGKYVAEVDVELIEQPGGWAPYLSADEALRLDEIRTALRRGDLAAAAAKRARVFELLPISA